MNAKYLVTFNNPRIQIRKIFDTKEEAIKYADRVRNRSGWTYKIYPIAA